MFPTGIGLFCAPHKSLGLKTHKSLYTTPFPLVLRMDNFIFEDPSKPRIRLKRPVHVEPASSGFSPIQECTNEVEPPAIAPILRMPLQNTLTRPLWAILVSPNSPVPL